MNTTPDTTATTPPARRRYWLAVSVPADAVDEHLSDALAYAADRAEHLLQVERGYDARVWVADDDHPADGEPTTPRVFTGGVRTGQRPAALGALLDHVAAQLPDDQDAEEQRTPAEGDRYVKRAEPDADRIVTVERVWTADDGHTAVAYQWHNPRASYSGSACPLDVFHRTYRPQDDA